MNYGILLLKIVAIFFCLILVLRILGKREVGELSIFDLVVLLIIADIGALGIDNDAFIWPSYFCVFVLVVLQKLLSFLLIKVAFFRNIIDGSPTTIVMEGKLMVANMRKESYTVDDLVSQMRLEHIMDIDEIKLAILETNGTLSIFRKERFDEIKLPVILSGQIVKDSLTLLDWEYEAFLKKLEKHHLQYKNIIYASLHKKTFYFYYRKDKKAKELAGHTIELT
ncbi:MAG: DUF421 domain-containing protein [Anaeroplasmataceae bacterium]|nr:DUF421 domain-containing protein [Anaeroplasmataceae bacterium]